MKELRQRLKAALPPPLDLVTLRRSGPAKMVALIKADDDYRTLTAEVPEGPSRASTDDALLARILELCGIVFSKS